jgi:CheY-like chemotaxis protein
MQILLIDDSLPKLEAITACIKSSVDDDELEIDVADCLAEAVGLVSRTKYDLIVMDLLLPFTKGGQPVDASGEVSQMMSANELNRRSYVISLSEYKGLVDEQKENFLLKGIILQHYDEGNGAWQKTLTSYIARVRSEVRLDFIVICALEDERDAFSFTLANCGEKHILQGLDCQNIQIEGLKGLCILLPTMGLVEAAIVTTRAVDKFNPRLVAMSGVCGGYSKNSNMGQILIANPTWEYQSGKW